MVMKNSMKNVNVKSFIFIDRHLKVTAQHFKIMIMDDWCRKMYSIGGLIAKIINRVNTRIFSDLQSLK